MWFTLLVHPGSSSYSGYSYSSVGIGGPAILWVASSKAKGGSLKTSHVYHHLHQSKHSSCKSTVYSSLHHHLHQSKHSSWKSTVYSSLHHHLHQSKHSSCKSTVYSSLHQLCHYQSKHVLAIDQQCIPACISCITISQNMS